MQRTRSRVSASSSPTCAAVPLAVIGFRIGAEVLGFDPATKADGVTSVRRGYLPHELEAILRDAGVRATVHRRPGYRLVAAWRTA